ncbi:MAG TPA: hypothetical protein VNZ22_18575 [Bacillota bacterium]|nr:hypothetical protein [Bacillota bacterium]
MWTCPKCGEQHDKAFDSCWKCAGSPPPTATESPRNIKPISRLHVFTVFAGLMAAFVFTVLARQRQQEASRIQKGHQWIREAVQQLGKAGPPPPALRSGPGSLDGAVPGYLVFSNGWAAFRMHSVHDPDGMDDMAVLRFSDGSFHFSKLHFCGAIFAMQHPPDGTGPQPADASDFLQRAAKLQDWNLLSPDGHVWCVVLSDRTGRWGKFRKALWVWIGSFDGPKETTLFEHRYGVSGSYVSWNIQWASTTALQIHVFNYGNSSPFREYDSPTHVVTNHLLTLHFQQDPQTGKFTQRE